MGVTGLWPLIDSAGHPIALESLENKILAIDLSIWINQSIKGFRDKEGRVLDNAHVLGLFHRICKLLFYKIKPVFVFDGGVPQLKRRTIERRHEQRAKAIDKSRQASAKVLHSYVASQLSVPIETIEQNFSLPSLKSSLIDLPKNKSMQMYEQLFDVYPHSASNEINSDDDSDEESDSDEALRDTGHLQNLDHVDYNSEEFKSLTPEIRHEILSEVKQKYKGWRNTGLMPAEANEFSSYQMKRLLKKRDLQHNIEQIERELKSQTTYSIKEWTEKNLNGSCDTNAGRLASDENTHFILMKKSQLPDNDFTQIKDKIEETIVCKNNHRLDVICDNNNSESNDLFSKKRLISENSTESENDYCDNQCSNIIDNSLKTKKQTVNQSSCHHVNSSECLKEYTPNNNDSNNNNNRFNSIDSCVPNLNQTIDLTEDSVNEDRALENCDKTIELSDDSDDDDFEEVETLDIDSITDKVKNNCNHMSQTNSRVVYDSALKRFSVELTDDRVIDDVIQSVPVIQSSPKKSKQEDINDQKVSNNEPSCSQLLADEVRETHREAHKQNRYANSVTDKMMNDCQELLKLFGVPYVISPMEAEAQCAALEELGLTNGTITDDSDVLLFGARNVYKNFFTTSKYVENFKSSDIESRFGLSRSSLVCIALLCGSDYTDGVDGVGPVAATEILSEFPGDGIEPLIQLKDWWLKKKNSSDKRPENKNRAKFLRLKLSEAFPNKAIFDAYIHPNVDNSTEKFCWAMPRLDELRGYALERFRWSLKKADDILLPVMKKVNEKRTQLKIDNFFKVRVQPNDTAFASKRLNNAIDKLRGSKTESLAPKNLEVANLKQKVKNQRKKRLTKKDQNKRKCKTSSRRSTKLINLSESSDSE